MPELALAFLELSALVVSVLALHRLRPRFGLAPLLAFLSGLVVLAQLANYAYPFLGIQTNAAVLMVAVVLMAVLLLLAADGVVAATQALAAVVGLSLLVFFAGLFNHVRATWLGPGSVVPIVPGQTVMSLNPRLILNSILALYTAFRTLILVHGRVARRGGWWAHGLAPGLALIAGLWSDALVFNLLFELRPAALLEGHLWRDVATKTVLGVLLWPVLVLYLRGVPRASRPAAERTDWSLFDVLFGSVGRMESDLTHARDALRSERDVLRRLAETSPVGILRFEADGRLAFANARAGEVLGLAVPPLVGRLDADPIWRGGGAHDPLPFREVRESGRSVAGARLRFDRPDGATATLSVNATPLSTPSGEVEGVVATLDDVTLERRAEVEREALIRELEQRNEELERFTYTVSHDLKSPLITVRGFLGHLERAARERRLDDFERDLARVVDATDRMELMLGQLLELSRSGRAIRAVGPVDLGAVARQALALVEGRLADERPAVEIAADLPTVEGDQPRLLEVLLNLLENAIKFSQGQSGSRIEVGWRPGPPPVYFVRDDGRGIDPRHHDTVFGLFDKLDPASEGSGVGLALVKRIVEAHGGRVWVESEGEGRGATLCFTLWEHPGS